MERHGDPDSFEARKDRMYGEELERAKEDIRFLLEFVGQSSIDTYDWDMVDEINKRWLHG